MTTDLREQPRGVVHRIVGESIDPVLRPVLGVALLQAVAESAQASFLGLWALRSLGSSQAELGIAFAGAAIAAVIAGNVGGHLSDRIGRRRPILLASAALALLGGCLAFVGGHVLVGLALIVLLGGAAGMLFAAQQALLTDLVPRERHEHAFASQRVVQNIGFVGGPLLGAVLLTMGWRTLFVGIAVIGLLAFVVAIQAIPQHTVATSDEPGEASSLRTLIRDPSFAFLLAAGTLATMVYLSYETLLPISLVQGHGVAPAAWGILLAINPIVVVLCQIRLTSRVKGVSEFTRLAVGIVAMGTPFLFVAVSTALPLLVLMLLLFVLGEMLWGPPSQGLIARLAPDDMRGAYFGASSAMWPAAFALGPFIGLQIRGAFGDTAMWCSIAIIAALAIALYAIAVRLAGRSAKQS
jgi:predicted MFS family arabinose efflux permease